MINIKNIYLALKQLTQKRGYKILKQIDLTKEKTKKESVLGKIADYKKEEKRIFKPKTEKNKDIGVEI